MHLIVTRTIDDVGRQLGKGKGCGVETLTTDTTTVLVTTHTVTTKEGGDDTWELDTGISTILIVIHRGATTCRPLIGTMQVNVYLLTATESITTGDTQFQFRSHSPNSAGIEIGFDIKVPRLVEHTVKGQVQRVTRSRRITRCENEIGRREKSHGIEFVDRLHIVVITI